MSVIVVTGYVPLFATHRTQADYWALGSQLLQATANVVCFRGTLQSCWLYEELTDQGRSVQNGGKDTDAYHCVQHQKTEWLESAAKIHPASTLVWIDFAVLHLRGVTAELIQSFLRAVAYQPPKRITSPSCGRFVTPEWMVNWTFCGGVLLVPAVEAAWFHSRCMAERRGAKATWEVNTWASVMQRNPDRFHLYPADHNESLFAGYSAA